MRIYCGQPKSNFYYIFLFSFMKTCAKENFLEYIIVIILTLVHVLVSREGDHSTVPEAFSSAPVWRGLWSSAEKNAGRPGAPNTHRAAQSAGQARKLWSLWRPDNKSMWRYDVLEVLLRCREFYEMLIISWPEHNLFSVSFCDSPLSIVCLPSSVVWGASSIFNLQTL